MAQLFIIHYYYIQVTLVYIPASPFLHQTSALLLLLTVQIISTKL